MTRHLLVLTLALVACGGKSKGTVGNTRGNGPVTLAWSATQGEGEQVDVVATVDGKPVKLGTLSAAADDAPGTPKTCSIVEATPSAIKSVFSCGATPAYNFFEANLEGGVLVISLVSGVDTGTPEDAKEDRKEVTRVPITGAALEVAPFTP